MEGAVVVERKGNGENMEDWWCQEYMRASDEMTDWKKRQRRSSWGRKREFNWVSRRYARSGTQ